MNKDVKKKIGEKLHNIGLGKDFLDIKQRAKIDKWDYIKL